MRNTIKYVVMSKRVARAYLEREGEVTSTITVYAGDLRALDAFARDIQAEFNSVSSSRGFDYVTFLTSEREVADEIARRAGEAGLMPSGF